MSMESHNQAAAREARRFLADRVRNDWSFPDTPQPWDSSDDGLHGVHEFRERFYGSTDDDTVTEDEEEHLEAASPREEQQQQQQDPAVTDSGATTTGSETRRQRRHQNDTKFRFEHPDGVADEMTDRALRRKRRRRRRLLAEMQWNEGLATFIAQRDAWTGATAARKHLRRKASDVAAAAATTTTTTTTNATSTIDGSPTTATSPSSSSTAPLEAATQATLHLHNLAASDDDTDYEPRLPVAPKLLPHNPIRDSITPRSYPDIYSKIVLQSQTPKVPINLKDMTAALVSGWKADGEWPPKPSPADPLVGAARSGNRNSNSSRTGRIPGVGVVGGGVGKVAAVLTGGLGVGGGGGGGGGGAGASAAAAEKGGLNAHAAAVPKSPTAHHHHHHHEFLSHHPHVKRGVDSVRKVFRLSGSGGGHHDHGTSPAA